MRALEWNRGLGGMSYGFNSVQFIPVAQSCSTLCCPMTAAQQASLSISNSRSLLKLMSIEAVMPSNHLILCCPLLLSSSIFPSIRVFSNESDLLIKWPKYYVKQSLTFSISPKLEKSRLKRESNLHRDRASVTAESRPDSKPHCQAFPNCL